MSLTKRERLDFFDAMSPGELRDAWIYLVGSWPEAVDDAIDQVKRLRKPAPHVPSSGLDAVYMALTDDGNLLGNDARPVVVGRDQVDAETPEQAEQEPAPYIPRRGDAVDKWLTNWAGWATRSGDTVFLEVVNTLLSDHNGRADDGLPLNRPVDEPPAGSDR